MTTTTRKTRRLKRLGELPKAKMPKAKYSTDRFEMLIGDESGEFYATLYQDCSLREIEDAIAVFDKIFPNIDFQRQPIVVPLLADGSSQFPDAEQFKDAAT
jgi:hypothetical protein